MEYNVIMAGFGGQGVLLIGNLLAEAALAEGWRVTYMPSYGVEMRGGQANCTIVMSDQMIGSPVISRTQAVIAMCAQARAKYESYLMPRGFMVLNSSLVPESDVQRRDIELLAYPLNQLATDLGDGRLGNMVALGLYLGQTRAVGLESLTEGFTHLLSEKNRGLIPKNIEAIKHGMSLVNGDVK